MTGKTGREQEVELRRRLRAQTMDHEARLAVANRLSHEIRKAEQELLAVFNGQNDASSASSDPEVERPMTISREELDAKLAMNEARLETIETRVDAKIVSEISRLEKQIEAGFSEQRAINARIETNLAHTATARGLVATVVSGAVGVFVALLSVLALAGNRFDAGMNLMGSSIHDIETLKQKQAETDKAIAAMQVNSAQQFAALSDKLDVIIRSVPKQ